MKNLLIIGVGGLAREVYGHTKNSKGYGTAWTIKGFLDGNVRLEEKEYELLDAPLYGNVENYQIEEEDVFICAIANPKVKMLLTKMIEDRGGTFINLIHHTAIISHRAMIGRGVVICQFVTVSCDANIGNHVLINLASEIGHDASVGEYSSLMSYVDITGNVSVGKGTYWGSGSRALPHSKIENNSTVGAGSVVLKKVKENQTVFGIPAMPIMKIIK